MSAWVYLAAQTGRIQGGWSYVWTAYGVAWTAVALYSLSLWLRLNPIVGVRIAPQPRGHQLSIRESTVEPEVWGVIVTITQDKTDLCWYFT